MIKEAFAKLSEDLLLLLEQPVPRYTSYPPATEWTSISPLTYKEALSQIKENPLSFYVHIPFCTKLCSYCGCTAIANQDEHRASTYVQTLLKELSLLSAITSKNPCDSIHFGGGTPTHLQLCQLDSIMSTFRSLYTITQKTKISIEVDPRTIFPDPLQHLHILQNIGFSQICFGIQDLDERVQKAISRNQTQEMSCFAIESALSLSFESVGVDLVYGLPLQTSKSFQTTLETIISLRPHKISIFCFGFFPKLKANQKAIDPSNLPSTEERYNLFALAQKMLVQAGYVHIGMDHFVLPEHSLCRSDIQRSFQGYTEKRLSHLIGLGVSAIGNFSTSFFQNTKDLSLYTSLINQGSFATERGVCLSEEDIYRGWIIEQIMCKGTVNKERFEQKFSIPFDKTFQDELEKLKQLSQKGLIELGPSTIKATPLGMFFLRNIASCFDIFH